MGELSGTEERRAALNVSRYLIMTHRKRWEGSRGKWSMCRSPLSTLYVTAR